MELANTRDVLHVQNSNLDESRFSDAKLTRSSFEDVNLEGSTFSNTNLGGSRFVGVNLAGAAIEDANLAGLTINGRLVTDLIAAYQNRPKAVLYAKHLARMQAFYQGVFLFGIEHMEADHVVLVSSLSQLTIVQIPDSIASSIHLSDPPERRTETPIKLVFEVKDIAVARNTALNLGGGLDSAEREWTFHGYRICDGYDPEGNVVQLHQRELDP